jgi:hypothetical protein
VAGEYFFWLGASAVADQALAVPVEPVSRLDPSGFDPSRWEYFSDFHVTAEREARDLSEMLSEHSIQSPWRHK